MVDLSFTGMNAAKNSGRSLSLTLAIISLALCVCGSTARAQSRSEPRYRLALSSAIGYGITTGDWFSEFHDGISVNLNGRVALSRIVFLVGIYRHQKLRVDDGLLANQQSQFGPGASITAHLNEVYGGIGCMTRSNAMTEPFAYAEIALGRVGLVMDLHDSNGRDFATRQSRVGKLGLMLAGGVVFPVNRVIGILTDFNARLTGSKGDFYNDGNLINRKGIVFGANVGIVLLAGH